MNAVQVIGAGGIGCAVGYALRAAGVRVTFVEANADKVKAGAREGVRVDQLPPLTAEFVPFADWEPPPGVSVLLCTKCYDNASVLAKLPPGTDLIPIQNGFDPQLHAFGHKIEGIASFVSECERDRPHTRITRRGELHIGGRIPGERPALAGWCGNRTNWLAGALHQPANAGRSPLFRIIPVPDIAPIKHTKLMYNAAISPLAAAAGIDNGKLLSVPEARALFFSLLQENYRILSAAGIELGKVGPFHPRTVAGILRRKWLAGLMAKFFEPSLRGTYCSMAGEIQKGRTEIDNYNGHLIRLAEETGTPCPLNRAVYDLVVSMTEARAESRREVLVELANGRREPAGGVIKPPAGSRRPFAQT